MKCNGHHLMIWGCGYSQKKYNGLIQPTTKKHWHWFLVVFIVSHILIFIIKGAIQVKVNECEKDYRQIIECDGLTCHLYWVTVEQELREEFIEKIYRREKNKSIRVDLTS